MDMTRWVQAASLFAAAAMVACGSAGRESFLDAGRGDAGTPSLFSSPDANSAGPLDATIEENHVVVTIITLSCAGSCADVEAVATGGHPPYTFAWDDGSTNPMRHVCPSSRTTYSVTVTDAGASGEFARAPETTQVPLTADVIACVDGGTLRACDAVANVSPSGANPYGPWSYGESASLGAAFTGYTEFLASPARYVGLYVWTSGNAAVETNPAAYFNPTANVIVDSTLTAQAGQFFLHPGPSGEYSLARWTAPRAGVYAVHALFEGIDVAPTTTDVHVLDDGVDVASGFLNIDGGADLFESNTSVDAAAGDTIDFAVGNGGNGYISDSTALSATVCSGGAGDGG
jgi:hypothetical protein